MSETITKKNPSQHWVHVLNDRTFEKNSFSLSEISVVPVVGNPIMSIPS